MAISGEQAIKQAAGSAQAAQLSNASGSSPFVLACEHASNFMPGHHAGLGLDAAALSSHIAWDPGALAVAKELSRLLDAPLVASTVSRLLYDCNRPPEAPSAVIAKSENTEIPGNKDMTAEQRRQRFDDYYLPFRDLLAQTVTEAAAQHEKPALVTVHSFNRVYAGVKRSVEIGVLHDDDSLLADLVIKHATERTTHKVRRNEPYGPWDGVTHTVRLHGQERGLPHVMLEIRNDLIADKDTQEKIAASLAGILADAVRELN